MKREAEELEGAGKRDACRALVYQIGIRGSLGGEWTSWFGGMDVSVTADGDTLLTGEVPDQAALYGLLIKIRNLGLFLVSVKLLEIDGVEEDSDEF